MMNSQYKVIVGLSGGVDSAVSAYLLKQQGYQVQAVFMQNWLADQNDPYCTSERDLCDARRVCDWLGIGFSVVNFSQQYWDRVFQRCLDEFSQGRTPNPDIWCNSEIKFKCFLAYAEALQADFIATGHYVRKKIHQGAYQLLRGSDPNKDQSYFLYTLNQHQLAKSLFPVGELTKPQVRQMAEQIGLPVYAKKDSTGICFIGERNFSEFLGEYLLGKPGPIKTATGELLGEHHGLMFYTLGQRKGLLIGGKQGHGEAAWYVAKKDLTTNTLYVVQDPKHPWLWDSALFARDLHWVAGCPPAPLPFHCQAKIRYNQKMQDCCIVDIQQQQLFVHFTVPQRAITPGQSVVFYQADNCLGGGIIESTASIDSTSTKPFAARAMGAG